MSTIKGGLVNAFSWSCIYCIGCGLYSNMDKRRLNNKNSKLGEGSGNRAFFLFLNKIKMKGDEVEMKLYRKMVRPMIMFPDSHYMPCYRGIIGDENWYPEEDIPMLKEKHKDLENGYECLVFDEAYEELPNGVIDNG